MSGVLEEHDLPTEATSLKPLIPNLDPTPEHFNWRRWHEDFVTSSRRFTEGVLLLNGDSGFKTDRELEGCPDSKVNMWKEEEEL